MRTAVLTVSSSVAGGAREDASGQALARLAAEAGCEVAHRDVVADDQPAIEAALRGYARDGCALVFTTGGTGLTPDDVTPEATHAVTDRDAPGFAEALRAESTRRTPMGMLSRGAAGLIGPTLVINLPGSPKAIEETFPVLAPTLRHAVETLGGRSSH